MDRNVARYRVGARFAGLLIEAVMRIGGERASLPRLEVHHLWPPFQFAQRAWRASPSRARLTPKAALASSVPAIDWKIRSTGAPRAIASHVRSDVRQHADCVGISIALAQVVEHAEAARNRAARCRSRD